METGRGAASFKPLPAVQGAILRYSVTNAAVTVIDLTSFPASPAAPADQKNPIGRWVRIRVMGSDGYYATGNNTATLANINATIQSNISNNQASVSTNQQECEPIPQNYSIELEIPSKGTPSSNGQQPQGSASPCRYLAITALTGTANFTIVQARP